MDNRDNDNKTLETEEIFSEPEVLDSPDKIDEIEDISTPDEIDNNDVLDEPFEDDIYDDSLETPAEEKPRFGEREYNAAKDEKGHYDKNYYAERQKDLDQKVAEADSERKKNWKMNEGHEDERPESDGSNNSNKNVWDKVKDQANYANARKDQMANKVANVKNKAYQVTHPGEILKDKASEKIQEKTDDLKQAVKDKISKLNKNQATKQAKDQAKKNVGKVIGEFIKKNPTLLIYAGVIIAVLFIIIFIILLFSDSDLLYSYDYQEACKKVQYTIYVEVCERSGDDVVCHEEPRTVTANIEDYVKGMVAYSAAGMNSETLKAMAILARTYIIEQGDQIGSDINSCSYDVDDIGKGYNPNGITPQITKAVYDTLGYIVTVKKKATAEYDYSCLYTASQARNSFKGNFSDDFYYVRYGRRTGGNYYFQAIRKDEISGFPSSFSNYIYYAEVENKPCYGNNGNGVSINGASFLENKRNYEWQDIIDYYYKDKNDIQTIYKDDELRRVKSEYGFFDTSCNYNDVKVTTSCNNSDTPVSIKDYVIDVTKEYANGLTDEQLKALMIIIKTNALSEGNYNSSSKNINLNYCSSGNSNTSDYSDLSSLYDSIADYLYVSESYTSTITSLSLANALQLDSDTINELKTLNGSYNNILDTLYESSSSDTSSSLISDKKTLYSLDAYCTYYNLAGNNLYWWPIGSSTPTSGNIYGGDPSSTTITSYYSNRGAITDSNGNTLAAEFHKGYDIAGNCNSTVVIAAKGGTVSEVYDGCPSLSSVSDSCGGGYGNHIKIDHDDGNSTYYAHLYAGSITVQFGDRVEQGEKIALVGSSGMSSGCHLHFEVRVNNSQVDPKDYISPDNPRPSSNNFMVDYENNGLSSKANACLTFINSGFSMNATAALLQNIIMESGGRANNLENCYEEGQCCYNGTYGFCKHPELTGFGSDELYTAGVDNGTYSRDNFIHDGAGYGIAQFTYWTLKERLYDFAKSRGSSIGSLSMQLAFIMDDVKTNYSNTYQKLTGYGSASDLTYDFCIGYERPADTENSCRRRANSVNSTLSFVQSGCRE